MLTAAYEVGSKDRKLNPRLNPNGSTPKGGATRTSDPLRMR